MSSLPPGERGLVVRSVYCATGRCRSCHENGVCVSVTDRGRAVDEAVAERIFESFFTTKPQGLGLGLGLAICRSIVEQHGGSIVAVRNPEGGMTFEFFLPVATADVTAGAAG